MVVRLVRAGVGALLLLIAVPLALAGGGLLVAMEHRAGDDTFTARLERIRSDGTAVVVPDVDALLRADAPFARGGQTTLSLSAVGSGGPLFIGLGPDGDVERYLDGLAQSRVGRVRLARGPLPVELAARPARPAEDPAAAPAPLPAPGGQLFWLARSEQQAGAARLTWSPSALRGKHLALVIMRADGTAGIDAAITARLAPAWLGPTTGGLLMLGSALFLLALVTLAWPPARRPMAPALASVAPEGQPQLAVPAQPMPMLEAAAAPELEAAATELEAAATELEAAAPEHEAGDEPPAKAPSEAVLATLADVLAAADAEAAEQPAAAQAEAAGQPADAEAAGGPAEAEVAERPEAGKEPVLLAECELDRPAPEGVELDGRGPIELPPLPPLPAIELQFTWAPLALPEPAEEAGAR
ncbi:hypothetical protein [Dactylosporangium sp. CA-092794]|uniref:hypothetical protein n=1 Tax=Dactylosporangium sp. CA-092794 TaxID=3239929 RepID=UPI003D90C499